MPALKKYHDREDGFTLIELLIVVLIIGILAAVAIPVYIGIQNQAARSVVKADVNIAVKNVQVAVTEGKALATLDTQANPQVGAARETITTAVAADQKTFTVTGIASTASTPAARVNFTYAYDSTTGQFTESNSGSGQPSVISFGGSAALPDATTTSNYSQQVTVTNTNSTGTNVYTATGLPSPMTINASTGVISGTPSTIGAYSVVVTVTNGSSSASKTYTLQVNAVPTVTAATLPNPVQGTAYSQTLAATGTPNSGFTYALTSGALPAGLTLSTNGVIAGNPTATGSFTFGVAATNTAGQGAATSFTLVVGSAPTIAASTSSATTLWPAFSHDALYTPSENTVFTGYPAPTVSATGLPSGLSIDANTGIISGRSTAASGTYAVTLTATNGYGSPVSRNVTMNIATPTNVYQQTVDSVKSNSVGTVTFTGWAIGSTASTPSGSIAGDNSKANLRVDVHIDNTNYDFNTTNASRPDVNAAFGNSIGNLHGYSITLNATSGSHAVSIYLRDGNSPNGYVKVYDGTVVVK